MLVGPAVRNGMHRQLSQLRNRLRELPEDRPQGAPHRAVFTALTCGAQKENQSPFSWPNGLTGRKRRDSRMRGRYTGVSAYGASLSCRPTLFAYRCERSTNGANYCSNGPNEMVILDAVWLPVMVVYGLICAVFFCIGLNLLYLTVLAATKPARHAKHSLLTHYPHVTVQLPIFNELYVVERLLQAACEKANIHLTLRRQSGYDHSYYFISTFMDDHLRWHAARLKA